MAFFNISYRSFGTLSALDKVQKVPSVCRRGKKLGLFMFHVFRILFALFHSFGLLRRAAVFWNIVIGPDTQLQGAFVTVVGHAPGVIGFRVLSPIALIP